jgi:hypothetical protein
MLPIVPPAVSQTREPPPPVGRRRSYPVNGPVRSVILPLSRERALCRVVRNITAELFLLTGERILVRRERRRTACHIRQIAMYVCHVSLSLPMSEIGIAFGRDRTTVSHACVRVEDRRDDRAFDEFVGTVERIVLSIAAVTAGGGDD